MRSGEGRLTIRNILPSSHPSSGQTWAVLAGLRFLLATLVTLNHSYILFPLGDNSLFSSIGGTSAVLGFFVISGFSIAHSLERPKGYAARRIVRILPLYYASILFALLPVALYGPVISLAGNVLVTLPATSSMVALLFFLQGVVIMCPMLVSPLWSISCEVFYYCCAPWLKRRPTELLQLLAFISLLLYAVAVYKLGLYFVFSQYFIATLCLTWAWLAGFLYYTHPRSRITLAIIAIGALLVFNPTFTIALLLIFYAPRIRLSGKWERLCIYLGDLSYPLYLTHWTTFVIVGGSIIGHSLPWWFFSVVWIITIAVAIFFCQAIDAPIRTYFRGGFSLKKREVLIIPAILFCLGIIAVPLWPVQKATRILPLGDSITYGLTYGEPAFYSGYRQKLEQILSETKVPIAMVGSLRDEHGKRHDGYSGWRIDQLSAVIPEIIDNTHPHIVLLEVGTNDLLQHTDSRIIEKRIVKLLDILHFVAPGSIVLMTSIPPLCHTELLDKIAPESPARVNEFNVMLKRIITENTVPGRTIQFVDVNGESGITCSDMNDGVHPNQAGYGKMASAWASILQPYLVRIMRD